MKKQRLSKDSNSYNFKFDEEYKLYSEIGKPGARFYRYTDWHKYVYNKYSAYKNIPSNIVNFEHFLIYQCNMLKAHKETYTSNIIPFISIIATIVITQIFEVVGMIYNYNTTVSTLIDTDYVERFGSDIFTILEGLEYNLYEGFQFYFFGSLITFLFCYILFMFNKFKIENIEEKLCFYSDYISIINEISPSNKLGKQYTDITIDEKMSKE